jgi:hypothetical protein
MVAGPFFCSVFATTRHIICRLWHFAQLLGRPLAYRVLTSAIYQRLAQGALPDMPKPADFSGFFLCRPRYAKNRQWIRCRVAAKSTGSEDPGLTSMGALLYGP